MSILENINTKINVLKEMNVQPSNIHIDYNTLCDLCEEIGLEKPRNGINNIKVLDCWVTVSLKERELSVH